MKAAKSYALFAAAMVAGATAGAGAANAQPNPILYMTGNEYYTINGQNFVRYRYDVFNKAAYPAAMFAPAPGLPPCGTNTNSSRTWVHFYENRTNRQIYGFCGFNNPSQLGSIWFALPEGQIPPSYVYIKLVDRQTNTTYQSNLADTTM